MSYFRFRSLSVWRVKWEGWKWWDDDSLLEGSSRSHEKFCQIPSWELTSGQISIIPKPELRWFWRDSLTKPSFGVTSAEVAIICVVTCPPFFWLFWGSMIFLLPQVGSAGWRVNVSYTIPWTPITAISKLVGNHQCLKTSQNCWKLCGKWTAKGTWTSPVWKGFFGIKMFEFFRGVTSISFMIFTSQYLS